MRSGLSWRRKEHSVAVAHAYARGGLGSYLGSPGDPRKKEEREEREKRRKRKERKEREREERKEEGICKPAANFLVAGN